MADSSNADEIRYLVARCHLLLDHIEAAEPGFRESGAQIRSIVATTAAKQNVRGMRTIRRDLLSMSEGLPLAAQEELRRQLDVQAAEDPFGRAAS